MIDPITAREMLLILMTAGLISGFFRGVGSRRTFSESVDAVAAARYYSQQPVPRYHSPKLPSGIFNACLFCFIPFLGRGYPFLVQHFIFSFGLVVCAASSGFWLLANGAYRARVLSERQARIDQFMEDPNAPVPEPVPDNPPEWLGQWKWLNVVLFGLLFADNVLALLGILPVN